MKLHLFDEECLAPPSPRRPLKDFDQSVSKVTLGSFRSCEDEFDCGLDFSNLGGLVRPSVLENAVELDLKSIAKMC